MSLAQTGGSQSVNDDVFMYRWLTGEDISMWWFLVYKSVVIVAAAGPPEVLEEDCMEGGP